MDTNEAQKKAGRVNPYVSIMINHEVAAKLNYIAKKEGALFGVTTKNALGKRYISEGIRKYELDFKPIPMDEAWEMYTIDKD